MAPKRITDLKARRLSLNYSPQIFAYVPQPWTLEEEPASDDLEADGSDDGEGSETEAESQPQDEQAALVHLASSENLDSFLLTLCVEVLGRPCLLRGLLCSRSPLNNRNQGWQ